MFPPFVHVHINRNTLGVLHSAALLTKPECKISRSKRTHPWHASFGQRTQLFDGRKGGLRMNGGGPQAVNMDKSLPGANNTRNRGHKTAAIQSAHAAVHDAIVKRDVIVHTP